MIDAMGAPHYVISCRAMAGATQYGTNRWLWVTRNSMIGEMNEIAYQIILMQEEMLTETPAAISDLEWSATRVAVVTTDAVHQP